MNNSPKTPQVVHMVQWRTIYSYFVWTAYSQWKQWFISSGPVGPYGPHRYSSRTRTHAHTHTRARAYAHRSWNPCGPTGPTGPQLKSLGYLARVMWTTNWTMWTTRLIGYDVGMGPYTPVCAGGTRSRSASLCTENYPWFPCKGNSELDSEFFKKNFKTLCIRRSARPATIRFSGKDPSCYAHDNIDPQHKLTIKAST
jgi:hypothetical protein